MPVHGAFAETQDGADFPTGFALCRPRKNVALSLAQNAPALTIGLTTQQRSTTCVCVHTDKVKRSLRFWFVIWSLAGHGDACLESGAANNRDEETFIEAEFPGDSHDLGSARPALR